jgi:hypothetical protein
MEHQLAQCDRWRSPQEIGDQQPEPLENVGGECYRMKKTTGSEEFLKFSSRRQSRCG